MNTVRLDLYGQERGAVRALLSGNVIEEHCGRVSAQQSPIGEGWEVNELSERLVVSSRAPETVVCEGGQHGGVVVAASCAAVR